MLSSELKATVAKLDADERSELETFLKIQKMINDPAYREEIGRRTAEMRAGKVVTAEEVEALVNGPGGQD